MRSEWRLDVNAFLDDTGVPGGAWDLGPEPMIFWRLITSTRVFASLAFLDPTK